jgi:hypothetical protein
LIYTRGGIDTRAFDFNSIYALRQEYDLPSILGYFMNWSTKVLCPFFFTYFYFRKRYSLMLPVLILQILMYLSFGNKAFLFSLGILIMTIVMAKGSNFIKGMAISMSVLNISAYFLNVINITDALQRAIPYRLTFIPAQIQYQYYEFFSVREKLNFADSIIGQIFMINSPYNEKIGFVIGSHFSHNGLGSNSNTGIFADAYANGGILAMIFVSLVLGIVLNIIDASTRDLPVYVVVGSLSYIMFVLNDTSLLTTLLTGGMLIMIVLLILFNSSILKNEEVNKQETIKVKRNIQDATF